MKEEDIALSKEAILAKYPKGSPDYPSHSTNCVCSGCYASWVEWRAGHAAFELGKAHEAARTAELEGVIRTLLASAHPTERDHPTMFKAWRVAEALLEAGRAPDSLFRVLREVEEQTRKLLEWPDLLLGMEAPPGNLITRNAGALRAVLHRRLTENTEREEEAFKHLHRIGATRGGLVARAERAAEAYDELLAEFVELEAERDALENCLDEERQRRKGAQTTREKAEARVAEVEAERDVARREHAIAVGIVRNFRGQLSRLQPVVEAARKIQLMWKLDEGAFERLLLGGGTYGNDLFFALRRLLSALSSPPKEKPDCEYHDGCIHADDLFKVVELVAGKRVTLPTTEAGAKALAAVRGVLSSPPQGAELVGRCENCQEAIIPPGRRCFSCGWHLEPPQGAKFADIVARVTPPETSILAVPGDEPPPQGALPRDHYLREAMEECEAQQGATLLDVSTLLWVAGMVRERREGLMPQCAEAYRVALVHAEIWVRAAAERVSRGEGPEPTSQLMTAEPPQGTGEECDQCGAKREDWQEPQQTFCPNHANPYGSCDGTLRPIAEPPQGASPPPLVVRLATFQGEEPPQGGGTGEEKS